MVMGYVVVAEKFSVANAIKRALAEINVSNANVTWVNGHVVDIDLPEEFKQWRLDNLHDILKVRDFRYRIVDKKSYLRLKQYFKKGILVIATDNDHEGELIGYEILMLYKNYSNSNSKEVPYFRMRFNSTNINELINSWRSLKSSLNWRWVYKAMFRQRFDLLTGAAYTRLLTLANRMYSNLPYGRIISWGSCQIPTLYFIVQREREIESFKSIDYWYIKAELEYNGIRFNALSKHIYNKDEAEAMLKAVSNARGKYASITDYNEYTKSIERPLPTRTDDALKDLSRITKMSAYKILHVMEELYSSGYISYPRTDTNRYANNFNFAHAMMAACKGLGMGYISRSPMPRNGSNDDNAHPPIYPTGSYNGSGIARVVWEYIARRFLANAYYDDATMLINNAKLTLNGVELSARGNKITDQGFFKIYDYFKPIDDILPRMSVGDKVKVIDVMLVKDKTKPPSRLSESELLDMMERYGIGTDATRAEFPSLIIKRGYAKKVNNRFRPTGLGLALINTLEGIDARLVKADTRVMVEDTMSMIEKGKINDYKNALDDAISIYSKLLSLCKERLEIISSIGKVEHEAN
jgi:DNA topoisomerase-1